MIEGFQPERIDLVSECLAGDDLVMYLAEDILDGEIEIADGHPFITDQMEYLEACEEVRSRYGVNQEQVEQAIEHAKARILEPLYDQT